MENSSYANEYQQLNEQHKILEAEKKALFLGDFNSESKEKVKKIEAKDKTLKIAAQEVIQKADSKVETNDKDYVFIHFILNNLPKGLIGLLLAVIVSAAMFSTASELNALGGTTALDLYKRNVKTEKSEGHFVNASKWFTLLWGIIAIGVACVANLFDNLIQLVNIIGSIFYGNILGMFLLAFFVKFVKGNAVFIAALITQLIIISVWFLDVLPYLWLNLLGCLLVMILAMIIETIFPSKERIA